MLINCNSLYKTGLSVKYQHVCYVKNSSTSKQLLWLMHLIRWHAHVQLHIKHPVQKIKCRGNHRKGYPCVCWIKTYIICASTYIVSASVGCLWIRHTRRKQDTLIPTDKYNQTRRSTVQPAAFYLILKKVPASFIDLIHIDHNNKFRHYRDSRTNYLQLPSRLAGHEQILYKL